MTILFYIFLFLFLLMSVVLCFVILIQEAKSLGLGASFGGDNSDSLFGTSTAEVFKRFTAYLSGDVSHRMPHSFLLELFLGAAATRDIDSHSNGKSWS